MLKTVAMKYGFFWLNDCQRRVLSGIKFISTGQVARLRSPRPTTSPKECATRDRSSRLTAGSNLHVAERVEILDRHVQFFRKKLRRVGHDGSAAGQEQPLRRRPALLAAVELQRLVDLDVQLGHELAGDLGDGRLMRVFRLLVGAAQADKALGNLDLLRLVKLQIVTHWQNPA